VSLEIVPLEEGHLEDAAALFISRFRALRERVPCLPTRYQKPNNLLPMLNKLANRGPGAAAIRDGRLVGFLAGYVIPEFRGKRSTFSPEWANAAELEDSRRIYDEMYEHLSARWVADGCLVHLVSLLPDDRQAIEGWHWQGFGFIAADGIRGLTPVPDPPADPTAEVDVRRGGPEQIEQVTGLIEGLRRHLAAAPTFLPLSETEETSVDEAWLADPAHVLWLAYRGSEAVGLMGLGPANPLACTLIRDVKTTSVLSAYTQRDARGKGIAAALLNQGLSWARTQGYQRCAVDWEPANILATRFWTRHFDPVSYTLVRHVDEGVA
jgi:GNAT superfamily N-acetyltransferase